MKFSVISLISSKKIEVLPQIKQIPLLSTFFPRIIHSTILRIDTIQAEPLIASLNKQIECTFSQSRYLK